MKRTTVPEPSVAPTFSPDQARALRPVFNFLNDKDLDILHLIFVSRKRQIDAQELLNRSQSSLVYDIKRIRHRLQFIHYLHGVFDLFLSFLRRERSKDNFTDDEMSVLTLMFYTSSFTMTARVLGISQVKVRHSFNKSIRKMEEMADECLVGDNSAEASEWFAAYEIFTVIRSNLNILRRLYREGSGRRRS